MRITLLWNERVDFIGKTRSGKSHLARYVCQGIPRFVAVDPKGDMDPEAWDCDLISARDVRRELASGDPMRVLIRGGTPESFLPVYSAIWETAEKGTPLVCYTDEIYGVAVPGQKPPEVLSFLYTQGRGRDVGMWSSMQRPTWVPLFTLSESEWFFMFRLQLEEDRKRVAGFIGPQVQERVRDKHGFWLYYVDWDEPVYFPIFNTPAQVPQITETEERLTVAA